MRKVFISHPLTNDPEENKQRADEICREIRKYHPDILPISPLHLFDFIEYENYEMRQEILKVCFEMIDICDEIWFYTYGGLSEGQNKEYLYSWDKDIIKRYYFIQIIGK